MQVLICFVCFVALCLLGVCLLMKATALLLYSITSRWSCPCLVRPSDTAQLSNKAPIRWPNPSTLAPTSAPLSWPHKQSPAPTMKRGFALGCRLRIRVTEVPKASVVPRCHRPGVSQPGKKVLATILVVCPLVTYAPGLKYGLFPGGMQGSAGPPHGYPLITPLPTNLSM